MNWDFSDQRGTMSDFAPSEVGDGGMMRGTTLPVVPTFGGGTVVGNGTVTASSIQSSFNGEENSRIQADSRLSDEEDLYGDEH